MSTLRMPRQERETNWYRDVDGYWARYKRQDDEDSDSLDLTDYLLDSGETVSAASFIDVSGPTLGTPSIGAGDGGSNLKATFTVTDTGDATLKVTTSGSRVLEIPLRWYSSDVAMRSADYS